MSDSSSTKSRRAPADHVVELRDLVVDYTKQETVDPLKTLNKNLGYGIAGSAAIGIGCLLVLLAVLRGLQSVDELDGNWSWVPYAVTILVGVGMIGLAAWGIKRRIDEAERGDR